MTTIQPVDLELDLDLAPAKATVATRLYAVLNAMFQVYRIVRNRSEIARLHEFSDEQLADIGLARDDVRDALSTGRFEDPSGFLAFRAQIRRRPIRRV